MQLSFNFSYNCLKTFLVKRNPLAGKKLGSLPPFLCSRGGVNEIEEKKSPLIMFGKNFTVLYLGEKERDTWPIPCYEHRFTSESVLLYL